MSDSTRQRKERLEALRGEAIALLREELLDVLREEWRRGCDNAAIPGGMDALREEYAKIAPQGVFVVLRYYPRLALEQRQKALTIAGKLLRNKMLAEEELAWIKEVAMPPKSLHIQSHQKDLTPIWNRAQRSLRGDSSGYSSWQLDREEKQQQHGAIKGNINQETGAKIYHVPGQKWYDETIIKPEEGERWFHSEEEAQAAGWRRSRE